MMKTGFGESSGAYEERQLEAIGDILMPVLEKSMLLAAKYCNACGRDVILPQDVEYAAKYCVMNTVGQDVGMSMLADEEESGDDSESDLEEVEQEECTEFTPYTGEDPMMNAINDAQVAWATWEPTNPIEIMLKNAIDRGDGGVGLE